MSSILDLTVKDILAGVYQGGGNAGKFVGRNADGEIAIVIALAFGEKAEEFDDLVDDFLDDGGKGTEVITQSVDESKALTENLLAKAPSSAVPE